jgi:hypothetical protein
VVPFRRWFVRVVKVSPMTISAVHRPIAKNSLLFVGISILAVTITIVGFWPTYWGPLLSGTAALRLVVHLHAVLFSGFLLLFAAQSMLVATGRIALHRKLGNFGIAYGIAIVVLGIIITISAVAVDLRDDTFLDAQRTLLSPLLDMIPFTIFFGAAVLYRRKPDIHKRFMLLAVIILLDAAVFRIVFLPEQARVSLWFLPIVLASGYDLVTRRFVHPIYAVGAGVMWLILQRPFIVRSDAWLTFSAWLITLAS